MSLSPDSLPGLSSAEAAQLLELHGPNALPEPSPKSRLSILFHQFQSPLAGVLAAAALLAFAIRKPGDSVVILLVLFANALLGAFQEGRAERSMSALRALAPLKARVRRDGQDVLIDARLLVPGDILVVAQGDAIPADAQLLHAASLHTQESALTGESLPVLKNPAPLPESTPLADRADRLHAGTHVSSGRGLARVDATGAGTQLGRIAALATSAREPATPLEIRMGRLSSQFGSAAFLVALGVVLLGSFRKMPMPDLLMVAMSQMVSLVPEGLPVALTIALAVGMQRLAARGAIVRKLSAIETLGAVSVICSDKTGTLTQNAMTVTSIWLPDGNLFHATGTGFSPRGSIEPPPTPQLMRLAQAGALCNDAKLLAPTGKARDWSAAGDPTEAALLAFAAKAGAETSEFQRLRELPFDLEAQLMATEHRLLDGSSICTLKGSPEAILELCSGDSIQSNLAHLQAQNFAAQSLRVLAVAQTKGPLLDHEGFTQFQGRTTLLGLVAQWDPPREDARRAVAECRSAGIRPMMITGDHKSTGLAVAQLLDIARPGDLALDGTELEQMPEPELQAKLPRIAVFARVHPAQKLRIVAALQDSGHVVAMTGDGVNDAPALARADVGVAMGIAGTEVAKNAARVILSDDRFSTLVEAVRQGRVVHSNLQKLLLFLLATSLDEAILLALALGLGLPLPLAPVQILWINLVTEGALTVNLVLERAEGHEMHRPPPARNAPFFSKELRQRIGWMVAASVLVTFGFYHWQLNAGTPFPAVQTQTFTLLAMCQWFNVLNCESATRSVFRLGILKNRWLAGGLAVAVSLQIAVLEIPALQKAIHTVPLTLWELSQLAALASTVLLFEEARKAAARRQTPRDRPQKPINQSKERISLPKKLRPETSDPARDGS
jgi:magnesium-transporting ATPase (P-type)